MPEPGRDDEDFLVVREGIAAVEPPVEEREVAGLGEGVQRRFRVPHGETRVFPPVEADCVRGAQWGESVKRSFPLEKEGKRGRILDGRAKKKEDANARKNAPVEPPIEAKSSFAQSTNFAGPKKESVLFREKTLRGRSREGEKTHDVANLEWQPALFPPLEGLDLAHEGRREECRVRVVCAGARARVVRYTRVSGGLNQPRAGTLGRTERQARVEPEVEHCKGEVLARTECTSLGRTTGRGTDSGPVRACSPRRWLLP